MAYKYYEVIDNSELQFVNCDVMALLRYVELVYMLKFGVTLALSNISTSDTTLNFNGMMRLSKNTLIPRAICMDNLKKCIRYYALSELFGVLPDYGEFYGEIKKDSFYEQHNLIGFDIVYTTNVLKEISTLNTDCVVVLDVDISELSQNEKLEMLVLVDKIKVDEAKIAIPYHRCMLPSEYNVNFLKAMSIIYDNLASANYYLQSKTVESFSAFNKQENIAIFNLGTSKLKISPNIKLYLENDEHLMDHCLRINKSLKYTFPIKLSDDKIVVCPLENIPILGLKKCVSLFVEHLEMISKVNNEILKLTKSVFHLEDKRPFITDPRRLIKYACYRSIIDLFRFEQDLRSVKSLKVLVQGEQNDTDKIMVFDYDHYMLVLFKLLRDVMNISLMEYTIFFDNEVEIFTKLLSTKIRRGGVAVDESGDEFEDESKYSEKANERVKSLIKCLLYFVNIHKHNSGTKLVDLNKMLYNCIVIASSEDDMSSKFEK